MLYPAINYKNFEKSSDFHKLTLEKLLKRKPKRHLIVSLNRYERKKDIGLAIRSYAKFISSTRRSDCLLTIAGGYDERLEENVQHYQELVKIGKEEGIED